MVAKQFYLLGEDVTSARAIDIEPTVDYQGLQLLIAGQFAIVEPNGEFLIPHRHSQDAGS
jgi:hypothetical protein